MSLLKCTHLEGFERVLQQDPAILRHPDVLYSPMDGSGTPWGIFDHGGRLLPACGYFRGHSQMVNGQAFLTPLDYSDINVRAPEDVYVYGGHIHEHYGHFLLSTLSRFWAFEHPSVQNIKIVYHAREDIRTLFERPFIADLFGAMGLCSDNFVKFGEPTLITSLIVPCPSFEETGYAHDAFSRLGQRLGDILTKDSILTISDAPVYLSKAKVVHGVGHLVNEEELSSILVDHGIKIAHPETLSLAQQITLLRSHTFITAMTGSSLHTCIFAPERTIVSMSYNNTLYTSYTMIDKINRNSAYYFYPEKEIERLATNSQFHHNYRLTEVTKTSEQFLRLMEMAAENSPKGVIFRRYRPASYQENPIRWSNVALGKPTRQSSFEPRGDRTDYDGHLSTATSGMLTGRYQFHTDLEHQPWWEVDLESVNRIEEIRLHNRSDNSQDRASRFVIWTSLDGETWDELHRQDDRIIFGNGLEGLSLSLAIHGRINARKIKITLLERTFLHLDQVEVFGSKQIIANQSNPLAAHRSRLPRF